jgi:hypothetical protein
LNFVVVVVVVKTMMGSSVFSSSLLLLLLLALLSVVQAEVHFDSNLTIGRNTLSGAAPLIIANGGTSGLYPDQTAFAYQDALNTSSQPLALLCDLQLTKDNLGICRTGLNLTTSTFSTNYNVSSTYIVNGVPTHGYFSVDYMQADLLNPNFTTAIQPNLARSPFFDQVFPLLSPDTVGRVHLSSPTTFWLNVEVLAQQFDPPQTKLSAISIAETWMSDIQFNSCWRKKHLLVADLGQFIVVVVVGVLMLMPRVI